MVTDGSSIFLKQRDGASHEVLGQGLIKQLVSTANDLYKSYTKNVGERPIGNVVNDVQVTELPNANSLIFHQFENIEDCRVLVSEIYLIKNSDGEIAVIKYNGNEVHIGQPTGNELLIKEILQAMEAILYLEPKLTQNEDASTRVGQLAVAN